MKTIICGAGIAGLTLAWWLRRDGWEVILVERAPGPRADGYVMDFFGSGYDVAERMDLLPALARVASPVRELTYLDTAGRRTGGLHYASMVRVLRGRVVSVLRGDLEAVLREAFDRAPDIRYGRSVAAASPAASGILVELTDGTREHADLLVGADGIHSRIREITFGPEPRFLRSLGFRTASYLFDDPDLRAELGDRFAVVAAPGRQVGVYPENKGRLAASLIHRGGPGRLPELLGGLGELADRVLAHCPDGWALYYDEVAQIELDGWSRGPVTLIGDACQAVSLMAGQGASLAMGGAWLLAGELATRPGDVPAALAAYERVMVPFVRRKQLSGRRTAGWMVPDTRWRIGLRDRLMSLADTPAGPALLRPTLATAGASIVN
jgi:2-polyprenyl-6-methoxyphenol hydroxylase-like FAD-dependent oxidoreductase